MSLIFPKQMFGVLEETGITTNATPTYLGSGLTLAAGSSTVVDIDIIADDGTNTAYWRLLATYRRRGTHAAVQMGTVYQIAVRGSDAGLPPVGWDASLRLVNGVVRPYVTGSNNPAVITWRFTIQGTPRDIAGAGASSPLDVTGLAGWWRSDINVALRPGSVADAWGDASDARILPKLSFKSTRPVYSPSGGQNNRPFMMGTGTNGFGDNATNLLGPTSDRTVFAMFRQTTIGLNGGMAAFGPAAGPNFYCDALDFSGSLYCFGTGAANSTAIVYPPMLNTFHYMMWSGAVGGPCTVEIDGVPIIINASVNIIATGAPQFSLMCSSVNSQGIIGEFYEGAFFGKICSPSEKSIMYEYIRNWYNVP